MIRRFLTVSFSFIFGIILLLSASQAMVLAETIQINELTIPILCYHKFCTGTSPDAYTMNIKHFEQQLDFLQENGYQVITVSQLLQYIEKNVYPDKPVVIIIDDGFRSVYELAFPLLKEYQYPATLFLYTNFINHGSAQLSWEEIREMTEGGMEIGSHTLTHCNLLPFQNNESQTDYLERVKQEIFLSKSILEKNTDKSVQSFAYPYGVYSQQVKMLAKQAGYQALLNVNSMNNPFPIDPYSLNRQIIPSGCSEKQFKSFLQEKALRVNDIFPPDGTVTTDQAIKIGAILDEPSIQQDTLYFKLSGSGSLDYHFASESQEISFTPVAPKLLQRRTWIAQIAALDKENDFKRKVSWLFTVK